MHHHKKPVLRAITLALLTVWSTSGYSAGLGTMRVHSALGQPLRVSIPLNGDETVDIPGSCIKGRLENTEGVLLLGTQISLRRSGQGTEIQLATHQNINEPAVTLQLDVACGMQLHRTYQLLLDPAVILPQTATAERQQVRQERASRPALAAVTPPSQRVEASESRMPRKKPRKSVPAPDAGMGSTGSTVADGGKMAMSRELLPKPPQSPPTEMRSVLRLSSDEGTPEGAAFAPGLRMSNELSESRDTGDPGQMAELRAAQQRFAALVRGEEPAQVSDQEVRSIQSRLQELTKENERFKRQDQERQAEVDGMRREMFSGRWVAWLLLALAFALGAIGWLVMRLRAAPLKRSAPFWQEGEDQHEPDEAWSDETLMHGAAPDLFVHSESDDDEETQAEREPVMQLDDSLAAGMASRQPAVPGKPLADIPAPVVSKPAATPAPAMLQPREPVATAPALIPTPTAKPATPVTPVTPAAASREGTEVEEISDLMQEAEFWMLLNDAARAIEILEPYSKVEQPVSPVPWIYLLDLYRVTNRREEYEALKGRIKQSFNTNAPDWGDDAAKARSLQDYPHLARQIRELWEGDAIVPYLESLLVDDRDGARDGFDLSVYREIIHLISVAHEPDIFKRRAQLHIGKSQPRLLSQHVTADGPLNLAGNAGQDDGEAAELDIFDRATSGQATARQMTVPKPAVFRAPDQPHVPQKQEAVASPIKQTPAVASPPALAPLPPAAAPLSSIASTPAVQQPVSVAEEHVLQWAEEDEHDAEYDNDVSMDMRTKLELAVAYQEIGEHVGARVLLEEVIQGGSAIQADKAKSMLKKLLKEIDWQ